MKQVFITCLLAIALITTSSFQSSPEIGNVPPQVKAAWANRIENYYYGIFGRYGVTTWYMDHGVFESITVYRRGSEYIRVFMWIDPQGNLLGDTTDL